MPVPKFENVTEMCRKNTSEWAKRVASSASESPRCVMFNLVPVFLFKHQNWSRTLADQNRLPVVAIAFISPHLT